MRVFFTVQGEGRGHLTQAMAMREMLVRRGHEIAAVVVGHDGTRRVPGYFAAAFDVPVQEMRSPGFSFPEARGVASKATLVRFLRGLPDYHHSLRWLRHALRETAPDVVINFLEPTMGLHNLLQGATVPTIVVGHQYMLDHPQFGRMPRFRVQQRLMRAYTSLVGARSTRLALSFYPAADLPGRRLFVCPPLLRQSVFELEPVSGEHVLVYLLNHGYAEAISRWHTLYPHIPVHCFYDKPGAPLEDRVRPNLTFHRLHGERFLRLMAEARAVACTAGFESVSEAAYFGKPLLMVPVENHVEQYLNACDAERAEMGVRDQVFRLSRLLGRDVRGAGPEMRRWVNRAESIAMRVVEDAAGLRPTSEAPAPVVIGAVPREAAT